MKDELIAMAGRCERDGLTDLAKELRERQEIKEMENRIFG